MIKKNKKLKKIKLTRKYLDNLIGQEFGYHVIERICENKSQLVKLKINIIFFTASDWNYTMDIESGTGMIKIIGTPHK